MTNSAGLTGSRHKLCQPGLASLDSGFDWLNKAPPATFGSRRQWLGVGLQGVISHHFRLNKPKATPLVPDHARIETERLLFRLAQTPVDGRFAQEGNDWN